MTTPVYSHTIKSLIVAFSSLFDEISYYNDDPVPKLINVPIVYSPREKWLVFAKESPQYDDRNPQTIELRRTYPRMGFELSGLNYSPDRSTDPTLRILDPNFGNFSYNKVPYDFQFSLYISTKTFEDSLKIVEQIIPFFTPELSITITDNSLGLKSSVPVILNSSSYTIDYESDFTTSREIMWTLVFTVRSYLYPPVQIISTAATIINGEICSTIGAYPGDVTFTGHGTSNPICSGGANVDFTFTLNGYLSNTNSQFTGTLTGTKTDNSTYTLPLTCNIIIKNHILYGEVSGFTTANTPIKGINFTFNFDLLADILINICRPITGNISCTGQINKLIKQTIINLSTEDINNAFEKLVSTVDPFTAGKLDSYTIIDEIRELQ